MKLVSQEGTYDKGTDVLYEPPKNKKRKCNVSWLGDYLPNGNSWCTITVTPPWAKTLLHLNQKVKACSFPVDAMVNDTCPTKIRLWNNVGVDYQQTSFKNLAASDRDIFLFSDAPHLIKLLRTNLLDKEFLLDEINKINSECVREVVKRRRQGIKITFKLAEKHI